MNLVGSSWSMIQHEGANIHHSESILHSRRHSPLDIESLPVGLKRGLVAISITSFLSAIATVLSFGFITYRLVFWRKYFKTYIGYNQYVILIYNLLIADMQQAAGFLISIHWLRKDSINSTSSICFLQGWLLQIADPSSGLFVLAIAVHTFITVLMGRKIPYWIFVCCVVGLWAFCLIMAILPPAIYGRYSYVSTGPWCWIDQKFDGLRLWGHYFWIFVSEFGSVVLYTVLFVYLHRRIAASTSLSQDQQEHLQRLKRVIGYMVLYPIAYLVLSLPIAAGRMVLMRGAELSLTYWCTAGAIIASSGVVDVIVYTITRRALLLNSQNTNSERSKSPRYLNSQLHYHQYHDDNRMATITCDSKLSKDADDPNRLGQPYRQMEDNSQQERKGSTDNMVESFELTDVGKVYQRTTIEIKHETADRESNNDNLSWPSGSVKDAEVPLASPGHHRSWLK